MGRAELLSGALFMAALLAYGRATAPGTGWVAGLLCGLATVVLAAAMWNTPHIIILDEPTNYLDRESLGAIYSLSAFTLSEDGEELTLEVPPRIEPAAAP